MGAYYEEADLSPYEEGWEDGYEGWERENPFRYGSRAFWDWEYGYLDGMHTYYAEMFRYYGY